MKWNHVNTFILIECRHKQTSIPYMTKDQFKLFFFLFAWYLLFCRPKVAVHISSVNTANTRWQWNYRTLDRQMTIKTEAVLTSYNEARDSSVRARRELYLIELVRSNYTCNINTQQLTLIYILSYPRGEKKTWNKT